MVELLESSQPDQEEDDEEEERPDYLHHEAALGEQKEERIYSGVVYFCSCSP